MATCRQVITSALRKLNVVSVGKPAPSAFDATTALEVLQSLYLESVSEGLFGRLTSVAVAEDYEAGEWERITNTAEGDIEISLPATVTDCETGETRAPKDLAVVVITGATPLSYLYEAQAADWLGLDGLTLDTYAPLSNRGQDGLASWLAVRLAEDGYGETPKPITTQKAAAFRLALASKYDGDGVEPAYF